MISFFFFFLAADAADRNFSAQEREQTAMSNSQSTFGLAMHIGAARLEPFADSNAVGRLCSY